MSVFYIEDISYNYNTSFYTETRQAPSCIYFYSYQVDNAGSLMVLRCRPITHYVDYMPIASTFSGFCRIVLSIKHLVNGVLSFNMHEMKNAVSNLCRGFVCLFPFAGNIGIALLDLVSLVYFADWPLKLLLLNRNLNNGYGIIIDDLLYCHISEETFDKKTATSSLDKKEKLLIFSDMFLRKINSSITTENKQGWQPTNSDVPVAFACVASGFSSVYDKK